MSHNHDGHGESSLSDLKRQESPRKPTPAEFMEMAWQMTCDAWAKKGESVACQRMQRHVVRIIRRDDKDNQEPKVMHSNCLPD